MSAALKFFAGVVLAGVLLGAAAVLYFFNPSKYGFYPVCQFHQLTGLNCPGCGGTRAVYQLLHGHVLRAMQDNALVVLSLAALAGRAAWFGAKRFRRRPGGPFLPPEFFWPLLVVALVFTVLRNLPAFSFLSP
ncbi:MAG TPA: DUF2752 domain-containing protein [Candidatus Acidoferrales bacterium]|nr:DUF2752 domain-containing protein [Candidatus Acidoferrales bacterium]